MLDENKKSRWDYLGKKPKEPEGPLFPFPQNDKWGYIDKTGEFVINPQFDDAWDF